MSAEHREPFERNYPRLLAEFTSPHRAQLEDATLERGSQNEN